MYNGSPMLNECLDCLSNQDFDDFCIHISDNHSSDETGLLCKSWASKDSRISYTCQPENIGPLANFEFLLNNCDSEYFMWRADDDYSDQKYVSTLIDLLDENPTANLAVPKVRTEHGNTMVPWFEFEEINLDEASDRILERLFRYHASWFYGLWRTEYLKEISSRIWSKYPYAYAGDHLILLSVFLDEAVVGSNNAEFTQRTFSPVKGDGLRGKLPIRTRISRLEELMPRFYECYEGETSLRNFQTVEKTRILKQKKKFTYEKLRASKARIMRLKIKSLFVDN